MDTARRLRYLDALGITVWRARQAPLAADSAVADVASEAVVDPLDEALERAIKAPPPELSEILPAVVSEPEPPVMRVASTIAATSADAQPAKPLQSFASLGWSELEATVKDCQQCTLCEDRQQAVFGAGVHSADLMVIGEGPGAEEDRQGLPFVGPAGKLLDAMLAAIEYSRAPRQGQKASYIANIVKCRPPQNRDPKPEEAAACRPYLDRQIALVKPTLIMAMGRVAAHNLLGSTAKLGELRQGLHEYRMPETGDVIPILVTYHPAYLLRSPHEKRKSWQDLKRARVILEQAHERPTAGV